LHDGTVLDIHKTAWPNFFNIKLETQQHLATSDVEHGRPLMWFALPGTARKAGQPLTANDGAMLAQKNGPRIAMQ
jgi:hypothetical protein